MSKDALERYDYLAGCTAPEDDHIYLDSEVSGSSSSYLSNCLIEAITALEKLDVAKKALFYGKASEDKLPDHTVQHTNIPPPVIHGILGIATEAGEMLDALYDAMFLGENLDSVNLAEEIGDSLWYVSMLVRHFGWTWEGIQATNINKLQARFPGGFKEGDAINRNLLIERNILEQHGNNDD